MFERGASTRGQPFSRILFLHYRRQGKAVDLAKAVKTALDGKAQSGR